MYSKFIATKAANNEELTMVNADVKDLPQSEGKETVFYRDDDGYPILKGIKLKVSWKKQLKP